MAHPNKRLFEPGPIMTRIAKEPRATLARTLLAKIEETDPQIGLPSYHDVFIIGGVPLEFQGLRRHLRTNNQPVIDLTATAEFPCNGQNGCALEILSITQSPTYAPKNVRSAIELSIPGQMAQIHIEMCIGRPLGDVIDCPGILHYLQDRSVKAIRHEFGANKAIRMRFILDDHARRERVRRARYPEAFAA